MGVAIVSGGSRNSSTGGGGTDTPVKAILNNYTWEDIAAISASGLGESYFSIGDCKAVPINGTVGTLSISEVYYVYIIGFNHNGTTNTIDFGTFKTAASGGVDIALVNNYGDHTMSGNKYFSMNHSADTNSGGWKKCDIRYDILGSTDSHSSDATNTTATNPVTNTLMAALPSDLRAIMKPMTIYTDNVANGNSTASNVTATVDYLPLLAEFELFGTRSYANTTEQNYQTQYAYYAAGNSRIKYRHTITSSAIVWWGRSPRSGTNDWFCYAFSTGSPAGNEAGLSYGLAPIFRV